MADISKVTLPNNETYDLKDSVARGGIGNAKLFYGTCSSAAAATEKAVTCSEFTANDLVEGVMINVKFTNTNSGAIASLTLNVNGTGAKSIKHIYNNTISNIPGPNYLLANGMYTFRYDGTYWVVEMMYNSNTTTSYGYYDYYFRPCAGTSAIYRYKIVGMGEDNRLYPIVTTNQADATQVAKAVQTTGIRPGHLWIYYATTTISAGGAIAAATLLAGGGANTVGAYSFNESIPTYRTIYLRGTYNKEKDLFYLYDDGASPCKSYYTFVPTNSAVTLSDYFVEGNYYMIVGGSYSTANYFAIFADNPLYYFDGTNLIPVSTKVAKDEITSMVGTDEQEDNDPYSFRKTANGKISGSTVAAYDEIVGGSIVWNQLMKTSGSGGIRETRAVDGITFTNNGDGSLTLNGTATKATSININNPITYPYNHTFFIYNSGFSNRGSNTDYITTIGQRIDNGGGGIHRNGTTYNTSILRLEIANGSTYNNVKIYPIVIDLTAAVTPLIADYIYTLETANAGDGVAWFKKYFPGVYYGFAEPHFEHVRVSAKNTVGFNLLNPANTIKGGYNVAVGSVLSSGQATATLTGDNHVNVSITSGWQAVSFVSDKLLPNTAYYINCVTDATTPSKVRLTAYLVDENYNVVRNYGPYTTTHAYHSNVTTTDKYGLRFVLYVSSESANTITLTDLCLNIHGDRDGEYEAYRKRTYPLDSSLTLRGIPKLDSANRLYFNGDIYRHDGSGEYRYDLVDLGTLNYAITGSGLFTSATLTERIKPASSPSSPAEGIFCGLYPTVVGSGQHAGPQGTTPSADMTMSLNAYGTLYFNNTSYTDAAAFKTAMSGVYLLYEKATPEPFTAEPFQSPMVVDPLGTEEFVDYAVEQGDRDVAIPVGHNTKYRSGVYGEVGLKADTSYVEELVSNYVPTSRTINSKALTSDITLTASDVGALPADNILTVDKGGTGLSSLTSGSFLRANSDRSFAQRTPAQVLSDIGAAASGHTHTTTIASGGTSQINLAANTAYTLTAGGTNYVFKTPADSDTKNTAGSTDTSSEIYLVGATSQAANPQTYSHDTARVRANGRIVGSGYEFAVASAMGTTKATMVYDATLEAIAFQFG